MTKFDLKCPRGHTTRDGREARIYATDGGGVYPIHGAVKKTNGEWRVHQWNINGFWHDENETDNDLINAFETVERWVNVYRSGTNIHETLEKAIIGSSTIGGSAWPLAGRLKLTFTGNKLTSAEIIKE